MSELPTLEGPPGWTQGQIYWCRARLSMASRADPIFVGVREWDLLQKYAAWIHNNRPITENPTLEPL